MNKAIVIVGAGHAGAGLAEMLRQNGWSGTITLFGDERVAPYQRPPLSKACLKEEVPVGRLLLRPESFYHDLKIDLRLGTSVLGIDAQRRRVALQEGGDQYYDLLVLATGSRPRPLPIATAALQGVFTLRTLAHSQALKSALEQRKRLVIAGAGYIGLEVAAAAREKGVEVCIIEREDRVLARTASGIVSRFYKTLHRENGVSFLFSASIAGLRERSGELTAVQLSDGSEVEAELLLVGIGGLPNVELLEGTGIDCANGVPVSFFGATSDPAIFAIGDVACRPLPQVARAGRLESIHNAQEQARALAAHLCGKPVPAPEVPWFWSDQYKCKLQVAGLLPEVANQVIRGSVEEGRFAVFHLDTAGAVLAVEAVNMGAEFMAGRQWIARGFRPQLDMLASVACPARSIVAAG